MSASERGESLKRSLALLWNPPDEPTRGPRPTLSRERIVDAAIAIADAEGLAGLSMRRIAGALGVGAMSLYRYIPGKDELVDLMVDQVYGSGEPLSASGGWRERLSEACRAEWQLYHLHPWLLHVPQGRPLLGPNSLQATEETLQILDGLGLNGRELHDVIATTSSWVAGLARSSVEEAQAATDTGVSDEEWWAAQQPYMERVWAGQRYPMLARVAEDGGFSGSSERSFEFGLERVLDGVQRLVDARSDGAGGAAPARCADERRAPH